MNRMAEPGLEIAVRPNRNSSLFGNGEAKIPVAESHAVFDRPDQPNHRIGAKSQGRSRITWVLALVAIVCLAVALGAGLGAGLTAQRKSNPASDAPTTSTVASGVQVTVTQSVDATTITPTPNALPSPTCPAANGSTYVATNKPLMTDTSQISPSSLSFEILCDTNVADDGGSVMDIQIITNVSSLNDCLDACALFNFQTKAVHFPAYACTGVSWGYGIETDPRDVCWLKSNVTLGSQNNIAQYPGYNGAVLLEI